MKIAALILCAGLSAGCGQKGPLVLPQPTPAAAPPAHELPATTDRKK